MKLGQDSQQPLLTRLNTAQSAGSHEIPEKQGEVCCFLAQMRAMLWTWALQSRLEAVSATYAVCPQ